MRDLRKDVFFSLFCFSFIKSERHTLKQPCDGFIPGKLQKPERLVWVALPGEVIHLGVGGRRVRDGSLPSVDITWGQLTMCPQSQIKINDAGVPLM